MTSPIGVIATHKIIRAQAPGQDHYSFDSGLQFIMKGLDIYYNAQSRYRKCALVLVSVAFWHHMEPVKFTYHRGMRIGTLHVLDHNLRTADGQPWPTSLDVKED